MSDSSSSSSDGTPPGAPGYPSAAQWARWQAYLQAVQRKYLISFVDNISCLFLDLFRDLLGNDVSLHLVTFLDGPNFELDIDPLNVEAVLVIQIGYRAQM